MSIGWVTVKGTRRALCNIGEMAKQHTFVCLVYRGSKRSLTSDGLRKIVEVVKRLDKALADFQSTQAAIGSEMGIQSTG